MASTPTTVTKSVTLQAGESFVLPPGAVLLGASDTSLISSTCDLPTLEPLACYVCIIAAAANEGSASQYFEAEQAHVNGFRLNGVETLFDDSYEAASDGSFNYPAIAIELKALLPAITYSAAEVYFMDGSDRGALSYILITTIASIAENLEIMYSGTSISAATTTANMRIPFILLSDAEAAGYSNLPTCDITPEA